MKLSKAQQRVIDYAKADIDFARTHTIREWAIKGEGLISEENIAYKIENYGKYYERQKNAICLTTANTKTLEALRDMGLIEIIRVGGSFPDTIKILNY